MHDVLSSKLTQGIDARTVSITSFQLHGPKLAEIVAATVNVIERNALFAKLQEKFDNKASPIQNSFRWVKPGQVMCGFVTVRPEVQVLKSKAELASFRNVASNMYLDDDDSAWELKSGTSGSYLVRTGVEDLPAVLSKVRASRTVPGIPVVSSLVPAQAKQHELVAYINGSCDLDYGVVIANVKESSKRAVLSVNSKVLEGVDPARIIESRAIAFTDKKIGPVPTTAGVPDPEVMIEYYKKAYGYSQSYLAKVIEAIQQQAAA